MKTPEI